MANSPQARKRARQAPQRRLHNASTKSMVRTQRKVLETALTQENLEAAIIAFKQVQKLLDRHATKGLIHRNMASRSIQRYNTRLKALALKTNNKPA